MLPFAAVAARRAVAKIHGLLTKCRNRKRRHPNTAPSAGLGNPFYPAGDYTLTLRRLIAPLTVVILASAGGDALAQGAFPAPLPGQSQAGTASDPAFPPVNGGAPAASLGAPPASPFPSGGAAPITGGFSAPPPSQAGAGPSQDCMKQFMPLREEAQKRGNMIKAAGDRHAGPDEACKLIKNFAQAEIKMMTYVEKNAAKCGIPPQVTDQLKAGHKNTEAMQTRVCNVAQQMQARSAAAAPTLSDVLGSSAALPEATPAKKGGSSFDTLTGNVLSR
jgi:hypothetical protein